MKKLVKLSYLKNQQNEEISIKVRTFSINKKSNGGLDFFGGGNSKDFYYTEQIIVWLELMNVNFPDIDEGYCDQLHIIIEKRSNGTTETRLEVPSYITHCSIFHLTSKSPYNNLKEMVINNENYNKVKIFETESNFLFYNEATINKLYFDFKKGIIGFDDLEKNKWRIVN